jgi:hypothetical protein
MSTGTTVCKLCRRAGQKNERQRKSDDWAIALTESGATRPWGMSGGNRKQEPRAGIKAHDADVTDIGLSGMILNLLLVVHSARAL